MTTVLVTGATGYIGGRLVPELLDAGHRVRCLARTPSKLDDQPWRNQVEVSKGDLDDRGSLDEALAGVEAAYFLVHSMGGATNFEAEDRKAAETFRDACAATGVGRIVYLGGLGRDDDPDLSRHLQSRHEVGRVLADGPVPVTELRAAIIIGSGSASFEMLRYLVEVLPVMTTPKWVDNRCQPSAISDVLAWLLDAIAVPEDDDDHVREIGGPDVLTYREMMHGYAEAAGLARRRILVVPVLTPKLSSLWVGLVTPLPGGLARPLVESLVNEVVVTEQPDRVPPGLEPQTYRAAVEVALERSADLQVATQGSDGPPADTRPAEPVPTDPDWAGGSLVVDRQRRIVAAPPAEVYAAVTRLAGGTQEGDTLGSWRVDAIEPPEMVRLRAEMRLPGEAWLEWRIMAHADQGTSLEQTLLFYPRGLAGRLAWYALAPVRAGLLRRLSRQVSSAAERRSMSVGRVGDEKTPPGSGPVDADLSDASAARQ